jgi:hypothetical protein
VHLTLHNIAGHQASVIEGPIEPQDDGTIHGMNAAETVRSLYDNDCINLSMSLIRHVDKKDTENNYFTSRSANLCV